MKKIFTTFILSFAFLLLFNSYAFASSVVYNNIKNPVPGNVVSLGYEATSTSEFGGQVEFAGLDRENPKVTVLMSSWGCESGSWYNANCVTTPGATFTHPITLNIYNVGAGDSVGSPLATKTTTFTMPYRPSTDTTHCSGGRWFDGATCFNGKAFEIEFEFPGVTLPNKAIITVAYNTTHYGENPIGQSATCFGTTQGCPYDSLNVGAETSLTVGTPMPSDKDAYLDSTWSGAYCDNGGAGSGTLRLDAGCWEGYLPSFKVEADFSDEDLDGVADYNDKCPNTVTDNKTWSVGLGTNRWQYSNVNGKWGWYQNKPAKKGANVLTYGYDLAYTYGCSGQQILELLGEPMNGHRKFGLSSSVVKDFHLDYSDGVLDGMYFIETVNVPANKSTNTLSSSLVNGANYVLKAKGTWTNSLNVADTEYASNNGWSSYFDGYDISPWFLGEGEFDLVLDDNFVNWGAYSNTHEYSRNYVGSGMPAKFRIFDGDSNLGPLTPVSGWYGDNTGSIMVDIYYQL